MEPMRRQRAGHPRLAIGLALLGLALLLALSPVLGVHAAGGPGELRTAADDYTVTFSETGLPSGTTWSVTMSGTTESSTGTSLEFSEPSGTYEFNLSAIAGYTITPQVGNVTVDHAAVSQSIAFLPTVSYYEVAFSEKGLPAGTVWSITLAGLAHTTNSTSSINFAESNGTYAYTVGAVIGYMASPSASDVTVAGSSVEVTITFTPTGSLVAVTFIESGLPSGTAWSVTMADRTQSSENASMAFDVPAGTYEFSVGAVAGYASNPSEGNVTVLTVAISQKIAFTVSPVAYTVEFLATGLPSGTPWSVTLAGVTETSNATSSIDFQEPDGVYAFTVGPVSGFAATPSIGNVTVSGQSVAVSVSFSAVVQLYPVTFTETGLPAGTSWSVTLGGVELTSSNGTYPISGTEPNGTYAFSVGAVAGYTATPSSGHLTVQGAAVIEAIRFSPSHHGHPAGAVTDLLGASGTSAVLMGVVASLGVGGTVGAVLISRRSKTVAPGGSP